MAKQDSNSVQENQQQSIRPEPTRERIIIDTSQYEKKSLNDTKTQKKR